MEQLHKKFTSEQVKFLRKAIRPSFAGTLSPAWIAASTSSRVVPLSGICSRACWERTIVFIRFLPSPAGSSRFLNYVPFLARIQFS